MIASRTRPDGGLEHRDLLRIETAPATIGEEVLQRSEGAAPGPGPGRDAGEALGGSRRRFRLARAWRPHDAIALPSVRPRS